MNLIVIINGCGGTGKDTFIQECSEFLKRYNIYTFNYSTIELVKEIMKQYLGWKNTKTEQDRKCMSDMKMLCKEYNNSPFEYVTQKIHNNTYPYFQKKVFFIHTREPEEIQEFIDYFDKDQNIISVLTMLLKRPNYEISSNESDRRVSEFHYDFIILNNDSLDELKNQALYFSKEFIIKFLREETIDDN